MIIMTTTIAISEEIRDLLENSKIHPRETYEDVIKRLLENNKVKVDG